MSTREADPPGAEESFRKTNSLAFSSTECHTCLANGITCDRRRPKCRTCLAKGWQCGGFATPLSWDNSRIWLGQSVQQQRIPAGAWADNSQSARNQGRHEVISDSQQPFATSQSSKQRQGGFRFVSSSSRPRKRRRTGNGTQTTRSRAHTISTDDAASTHDPSNDVSNRGCNVGPESSTADTNTVAATSTTALAEGAQNFEASDASEDVVGDLFQEDSSFLGLADTSLMHHHIIPSPPRDPGFVAHDLDHGSSINPHDNWEICLDLLQGNQASRLDLNSNMGDFVQFSPFTMQQDLASGNMQVTAETADREYTWFFEKYDSEYCALPITSDASNNPFRLRMESWASSPVLEHVVRALCYQHMQRPVGEMWEERVMEHREKAKSLLETASSPDSPPAVRGLSLLDSILLMITLDCTLSAFGKWNEHLHRAKALLDAHGGPSGLTTSRLRSQVAMLIWWDVTLALISRCGMTLAGNYYEHLIAQESQDQWSFYDLTGCPGGLIIHLLELADLAKQKEISATSKWLTLDMTPVFQVEAAVKSWQNPFARKSEDDAPRTGDSGPAMRDSANEEIQSEESINSQQDQYHVVEAWRFAILVYVQRVFTWARGDRPPVLLHVYARRVLDHVRCCRRTSQTQKQALLPIFLAGSETKDGELREFASGYCKWWTTRSRYNMFNTAATVLEEIWDANNNGRTCAWWGSIIDQSSGLSGGKLESQYLFG